MTKKPIGDRTGAAVAVAGVVVDDVAAAAARNDDWQKSEVKKTEQKMLRRWPMHMGATTAETHRGG